MCGPNLLETTASVALLDSSLHDLYNMRAAQIASASKYDCTAFDKNDACFTFAGRLTDVGGKDAHTVDGAFIGAYRLAPGLRIGGYLAPGLPGKGGDAVEVDNEVPAVGLFGDWAQSADGTGFSAHFSGHYQVSSVEIQRPVAVSTPIPLFFSEPGHGSATLYARGASAVFSYGLPFSQWLAAPYAGLQATSITRGGYTEAASASVTAPVTFRSLTERQTTAVAGLKLSHPVSQRTTLHLSGGLEHDFSHDIDNDVGTSSFGTSTTVFGGPYRQTRGVAGVGVSYDIAPLRSVTGSLDARQEALGGNSYTGVVSYQVGF